jgi:dynein intermediate chain 1
VIALKFDGSAAANTPVVEEEKLFDLAGGCCFDFHNKVDHLFVVGTEEGRIHKCSKDYNSQYLLSFEVKVPL